MKRYLQILFLLLIGFLSKAQSPVGLPFPNAPTAYYNIGWARADSGIINAVRDTTVRSRYAGLQIFWQHPGLDSNIWFFDGTRYFHYVKSGADVIAALGYTPLQNITGYIQAGTNVTFTGLGTLGSPYVVNATNGGGGGNFTSFSFTNQNGITGVVTAGTGPNVVLALGTSLSGIVNANGSGFSTVGIGAGLNYSGGTLSATGNTTLNGPIAGNGSTFITYAIGAGLSFAFNTLTNTINNTNQLTNGAGFLTNITSYIVAGANITITGAGTLASPYTIAVTGGSGGGITGSGNLSPLFTTSIVGGNTLTFTLTNANAHTFYGNFTGSTGAPSFSSPTLASADFNNQGTATTVLHGNVAGAPQWGLVNLSTDISNTLGAGNGGTSNNTYAVGDILYASGATTLAKLSDVAVNNVFLAGGVATAPSWGKLPLAAMATQSGFTIVANATGSTATPTAAGIGYGLVFSGGVLRLDSANLKDTIYAVEGLSVYGTHMDSIGLGGPLFTDATVSGAFGLTFSGLASFNLTNGTIDNKTATSTDSAVIRDAAGRLWSTPTFSLTTLGSGAATYTAATGVLNVPNPYAVVSPNNTVKGNVSGGSAIDIDITATQVTAMLNLATTSLKGLLPAWPNDATKYLDGTGNYSVPAGGGGGGVTVQRVTSGTSGTVTGSNYFYLIDPSSTIAAYAATLPASPTDGQIVIFGFGGTLSSGAIVTALSIIANSGQGIIDNTPPTSATADNEFFYHWVAANSKWYRFKP
jgi:hypothetical protein